MDYFTICAICGRTVKTCYTRWYLLGGREQLGCSVHHDAGLTKTEEERWGEP